MKRISFSHFNSDHALFAGGIYFILYGINGLFWRACEILEMGAQAFLKRTVVTENGLHKEVAQCK